jgi:uracil-DNA glycosylase family 4
VVRDLAELDSCTRCQLALTRQRVVAGSGPLLARLVVIGEAPGRSEDEGGEPFIGRSGQLLFRLIDEELGLSREQCFVTNVVKCRPPGNRTPTRLEVTTCRPWLDEQLAGVTSRVVLTLGNTAARAVLGFDEGIGVAHGRVVELGAMRAVATYHPAAALRGGPNVVSVMREDLKVVSRLLESP